MPEHTHVLLVCREVWRQRVSRRWSSSAMCAWFLDEELPCHSWDRARAEEVGAAEGQGVLLLALHPTYARRIARKLLGATTKPVCICLWKTEDATVPSVWLVRERDVCWEVQNWVKTLPGWLEIEVWFWFSPFSNSKHVYSRYLLFAWDDRISCFLKTAQMHLIALWCIYHCRVAIFVADI